MKQQDIIALAKQAILSDDYGSKTIEEVNEFLSDKSVQLVFTKFAELLLATKIDIESEREAFETWFNNKYPDEASEIAMFDSGVADTALSSLVARHKKHNTWESWQAAYAEFMSNLVEVGEVGKSKYVIYHPLNNGTKLYMIKEAILS